MAKNLKQRQHIIEARFGLSMPKNLALPHMAWVLSFGTKPSAVVLWKGKSFRHRSITKIA